MIHCSYCEDQFEPDGLPNFDEPNYCSESCANRQEYDDIYWQARYSGAPVFF